MIRTDQVSAVFREKLIIDPIEGDANVTAAVQVGEMFSLKIDQHSL
jgi:fructose-1,6-bisphosphatase